MTRISAIERQRDASVRVVRKALRALAKAKKDSERLNWLANCQVGQVDAVFSEQFRLSQRGIMSKITALRRAIDDARRQEERK